MRYLWLLLLCGLFACESTPAPTATPPRVQPTPQPLSAEFAAPNTLSGSLIVFEQQRDAASRINRFDLATLHNEPLFSVPTNGWVNQIALSPDGKTVVLAYSPPSPEGRLALDRSGLYLLSLDTLDAPQPLLIPSVENSYFYTPVWSPDGRFIFYGETIIEGNSLRELDVTLMRLEVATGETVAIAKDGIWPRVAPSGERLTFIQVDPLTLARGLVVSDLNGEQREELVAVGTFFDLDTPLFSADSSTVYFTVARTQTTHRPLWEVLTGVRRVQAHANHNVPSAWWRIRVDGEGLEQLSAETDIILHGTIHPVDQRLYFSTVTGLYVYDPQTNATLRLADADYFRTLSVAP